MFRTVIGEPRTRGFVDTERIEDSCYGIRIQGPDSLSDCLERVTQVGVRSTWCRVSTGTSLFIGPSLRGSFGRVVGVAFFVGPPECGSSGQELGDLVSNTQVLELVVL